MQNIFIVAAKRTPFGSFGGSLKNISATELATEATKAALNAGKIDPSLVDSVFVGNVIQSSPDAAYLARHVGLQSGIPQSATALTINRLCGSGFETVIQGATSILVGDSKVSVCAGTENMSASPLQLDGNDARWGVNLGSGLKLRDSLWDGLTDTYAQLPMGMTAENLAEKYGITREECDEFAVRSQRLWGEAKNNGVFDLEIAPVEVKTRKGTITVDTDEHPRPETDVGKIGKLKPVFKKDGVVTAASASGICDGAGSIILAGEDAVKEHGLTPIARLASYQVSGCDPTIMGIGPVPAIQASLEKAGITMSDVDRFEINEAFAAQFLACAKELNLDMDKTNIHGGAISLGHPLGASGSRIVAHLANEFQRTDNKIHVGAACIGGGQGISVVLERV
jgi:acetyl-CoA acyltransferase 2